jgi:hypothetical protein
MSLPIDFEKAKASKLVDALASGKPIEDVRMLPPI